MRVLVLGLLAALQACARPGVQPPAPAAPAAPAVPPGLERALGRTAEELIHTLGTPGLDRREGAARILQWRGPACILDLYLYPRDGRAVSTFGSARLPDGRAFEPAQCWSLLAGGRR